MNKYRSLAAWKYAHELAIGVLKLTDRHEDRRTWSVFDQLRRAAVSVETNIVEGYALSTTSLFRRHLRIALGSAAEVECLLHTCVEMEYLPDEEAAKLLDTVDDCLGTLYGLIRSLGKGKKRG